MFKKILVCIFAGVINLFIFSQGDEKLIELEKRVSEIEKQNKELQEDVDSSKRDSENKKSGFDMVQKVQWGEEASFEIAAGQQGVYSQAILGIYTPRIKNVFRMGFKTVFSSSQIYMLTYQKNTNDLVKHSPLIISGNLSFNVSSPLFFNFIRVYGTTEFLFGWTFNPVENYGINFSFGGFGYGGIEVYTSKYSCLFIEAGGGAIYTFNDKSNQYLTENEWAGAGFAIRLGTRIFFAKKNK